jgi:spore coat polysaccharide biosynthesis predicted glycosyltransferase SpsG
MASCAWAVTTGGTTMLEMLCLGKAIHVVPRTEAELAFAQRFAAQGALLGLGLETLQTPAQDLIQTCQQRGPQLVDGKGCERIAFEIESLL